MVPAGSLGRRLLERPEVLRLLSRLPRSALGRYAAAVLEVRALASVMARTRQATGAGGALGYLFDRYEPGRSASDIYAELFASGRYAHGYKSQMGQDLFLDRWLFKGGAPGFFVDVGAFDGELGSNTYYFEKRLGWRGVAFEPNPHAFAALSRTRSCDAIQGCAYHRDGEVSFLALSEKDADRRRGALRQPANFSSLLLDPQHGAVMLSGIRQHIDNPHRVEKLCEAWNLEDSVVTVPCHRLDTVLDRAGVHTVDYLSIDVEGAEVEVLQGIDFERVHVNVVGVERNSRFGEVHRLLTGAGFDYHGLLFLDEIFVHRSRRFTWER